jgi:beta-phosphoglucomutase-like phosphatase (HAD superfamily)
MAEHHLGRAGLLDRFTTVATRDDVARPKPHPGVHFEAARRLGVTPERCIDLKDSNGGLAAADAANAMAFMVPDILPAKPETQVKCLQVLPDLHVAPMPLRAELQRSAKPARST